ncbi:hypothetical protein J5N97_007173 [Dioscorea zingiberensis]|uniref:Uncharacterized protein n=1 Tax=Dioscorea zingiberensis TaxID=325984 RepID=A0A9D5HUU4_9LILI|nr:hypothetical protein J5N97_007173 [Dioscorea zingiberensis]
MPYRIQRELSFVLPDTYVITMANAPTIYATVASTNSTNSTNTVVREWVHLAMSQQQQNVNTVGIHAEPRRLNPSLIHHSFQPELAVLIIAFGRRILLLRLLRDQDLPEILVNNILRINHYNFVGMDIMRIRQNLWARLGRDDILANVSDVRELAVAHTRRGQLRTAGLRTIVRAVFGSYVERWPRLIYFPYWWSSENLSQALVLHGSIRVFMAVQVSEACSVTASSSSPSAQQETHLDQSHGN